MSERQIFEQALELTDPARREAFLSQACSHDPALRARIDSLLAAQDNISRFLEVPAAQQVRDAADPGFQDTAQLQPGSAATDEESSATADLSFLKPSTKPGSIGVLGHYEILQVLGQGAFGTVFKAFDEKLQRHVAIKTMNVQMAATSPPRKRFLREARAAAQIRHDNVTQVYSVEEEPIPYLVMEYIDGITLSNKLDAIGPLEIPELLHLGRQIALGLSAAHEQGLVHRDIKPGNILLEKGAEQKVKITDFGLARAADDASLTQSGLIAGTPLYMAPEQALGQALDARTDLFSFGSVLYQMAAGHPPFRAPSTVAVLRRVVDDTQRPLKEVISEIPDWFVAIVNKLLEKKADDRYQTAKEVAALLARCQSELQLNGEVTCVSGAGSASARSAPTETITDGSRIRKNSAESTPDGSRLTTSAPKPSSRSVLYSLMLGLLMVSPILFGKHVSQFISPLIWGTIPNLPVVERAAGLRFDGKDDFIQVPVHWDSPLLTIEAFVTPDESSPGGTLLQISNERRAGLESIEMFDEPNESHKPHSFVGVTGGPSQGTVSAPLDRGIRQHRAITLDDQYLHYYVNGMWQAKRKVHPEDQQLWKLRQLTIGSKENRTNFFTGVIDQVRISKVVRYKTNFAPITSVISDDSTLALYNFDEGTGETLKDSSGNGNDGKILGATWVAPAKGLQFDGVDDYIDFENLSWSSNQYTFETWVTPLAEHGTLFQIAVPQGNLHAYLYQGGTGTGMNRDKPYANVNGPTPGLKRMHLASVFDGQNLNYFVNGKLVGSKTNLSDETTPWQFQRLRIGGKLDPDPSKPEFFHGRMEQFRVSNKALYVLPFTPEERLTAGADTLALYNFDEAQGNVVKDASGHGHEGKIVGAMWATLASGGHQPSESPANSEGSRPPLASAPFTAEQARQHQTAWAKHLGIPAEFTDKHGMKFVLIPPGEFQMGYSQTELETLTRELKQAGANEFDLFSAATSGPQHRVRITQPFYMSAHEVTVTQYRTFLEETKYLPTADQLGGKMKWTDFVPKENPDAYPVDGVSWTDADTFCVLRSQKDGVTYRLPSEAEWEFACRAGSTTLWSFGENPGQLGEYAVTASAGVKQLQPVGSRQPNALGLFDMYCNAEEWCRDWHVRDYYAKSPVDDPVNLATPADSNSGRVSRGGSLSSAVWITRSSTRRWDYPSTPVSPKGFRVVISGDLKQTVAKIADSGESPLASASSDWIDVIPHIDPSKDKLDIPQVTGQNGWRKENTDLVIPSDERGSKLLLPLDSAWSEFECELEFTRRAGSGGFNVNLPTQQGECSVVVDHPSGPGGVFLGARNKGVVLVEGPRIETGKRATLRIELRREQNSDRVSIAVDGTIIGNWSGDRNAIGKESNEGYPARRRLSLWIHEGGGEFVFHRIRVKMLDRETATMLRPVPPTKPAAPPPAIAPFTTEQAKRHQEEWAASLKIPVEHTNSIGMKFQLIPPGEFLMGAPESDSDAQPNEKPQHVVRLTKPYYIGTIEVTVAHFRRFVEATKYVTQAESDGQGAFDINPKARRPTLVWNGELTRSNFAEAYPVRCVSWEDARRFCEWLGQTEGRTYRLPTEAEWEFACRAGTTTRYSFGNNPTDTTKPPHGNGAPLAPVAQFPANAFGLFDMHGNVNEICWDSGREYTATPVTDPISSIALEMPAVVRSGAVSSNINRMRSSHRFLTDSRKFPEENFATLLKGFRIVLVVEPAASSPTQARVDPIFSPDFEWSAPVNLGSSINTPARESNLSLTSDELLLVFTRDGEFFEARRESRDQPFGQAVKLQGPFANPKPLSTCCLSGDGLQLVFSSLALGEDKQDVLLSRRSSRDEPFGEPLRLPAPINSADEDRHPAFSPDGLTLALTTTRPDQRSGATLMFARQDLTAEFNPTPIVDPNLQTDWNVITSFSGDGRVLLMTTMSNNVETHTWHTRIGDTNTWSTGQPLPAPLSGLKFGAPFLSSDGSAIYFHSRNLPDGQGELDLWVSRRTPKAP